MHKISFSVVVPLYNKAEHIVRTLQSALKQSLTPFEIIVINDGSKDNGAELAAALCNPLVKIVHQSNGGVARARNTGIAHARGDWIAFLDADDWLHPDYLQTLSALITQHATLDMVATGYKSMHFDASTSLEPWPLSGVQAQVEIIQNLPQRWMAGTCFFTSSVAVRTSRLQALQPCFPPGESLGEDLDVWFRLAETSAIAFNATPLVARVWVPDGLSVVHTARTEPPFLLRMAERARNQAMPLGLRASTLAFVAHSRLTMARTATIAGDRALARQLLWRAKRDLFSRRWCTTALMVTVVPGALVNRWQHWRKRRKMVLG